MSSNCESIVQNAEQSKASSSKALNECINSYMFHLIQSSIHSSTPLVICSLIITLKGFLVSLHSPFESQKPEMCAVIQGQVILLFTLSPVPFISSCPFTRSSFIHTQLLPSPFPQMDRWLSHSSSCPSMLPLKTHWIDTLGGTVISAIHSLSSLLPLTSENCCPTLLFALEFPFTFSLSKMLYWSVFFTARGQPMTVWHERPPQTLFNSPFLHLREAFKGRKRIFTHFCHIFLCISSIKITAVVCCDCRTSFHCVPAFPFIYSVSICSKAITIFQWLK